MLSADHFMDIKLLHKQGHSIRQISRLTGFSRNTIRTTLRATVPLPFKAPPRSSKIDPFKDYLTTRHRDTGLSAVRLFEEIQKQGFTGSIIILRRFLATLGTGALAQSKATVRFETPPGEQAQVDWAHCGRFSDHRGNPLNIYAFVMVLGYSRMTFTLFTTSMDLPCLIDAHQQAFAFFNGVPQQILYDNMKQVRLAPGRWNPLFLDFANQAGFAPKTCRPFRPRTKGKVERTIQYIKDNFLNGRSFVDVADLNVQRLHWLDHTANVRLHATTAARPVDLFKEELLQAPGSAIVYRIARSSQRKVDNEGFVRFESSRYSVPPAHCGKSVVIESRDQKIRIHLEDVIIAEHEEAPRPGSCMADAAHLSELWKQTTAQIKTPAPSWQLTFDQAVATTSLSVYEEVA